MGYKIWTNDGWKSFDGIRKIVDKETIRIMLENDEEIVCTKDHKIYINENDLSTLAEPKTLDFQDLTST